MTKPASLVFTTAVAFFALAAQVLAEDGASARRFANTRIPRGAPVAYYPMQRYYTKGATIAYNFAPMDRTSMHRVAVNDPLLVSAEEIAHAGPAARVVLRTSTMRPNFRATTTKVTTTADTTPSPASETTVHSGPTEVSTPAPVDAAQPAVAPAK